jgi:hypothetical protein
MQTGIVQQVLTMHTDRESLHVRVLLLHGVRDAQGISPRAQMPPPVLTVKHEQARFSGEHGVKLAHVAAAHLATMGT